MGTTFTNLNIRTEDPSGAAALCEGWRVRSILPGWVTAASDEMVDCEKQAKAVSRALGCAVVTTEYFDDDFACITVYRDGKRAARHIPADYEGFLRAPGKPKAFMDALDLPAETEKTMKRVFKETNPELTLRLLSCVFSCQLFVDAYGLDGACPPEREYLQEYLARKAAESKIKNVTKLTQLDEIRGDFAYEPTYPVIENDGDRKTFWKIADGKLRRLFDIELPGDCLGNQKMARCGDRFRITLGRWVDRKNITTMYVLSERGEIVFALSGWMKDVSGWPKVRALHDARFWDGGHLLLDGMCLNLQSGQPEWELDIGESVYGADGFCRLRGGGLALVYDPQTDTRHEACLLAAGADGAVRARRGLPSSYHWREPVAWEDGFLLACDSSVKYGDSPGCGLVCYGPDLAERWRMALPGCAGQMGGAQIDETAGILYINHPFTFLAVDLKNRRLLGCRELGDGESRYDFAVLPGRGVLICTSPATVQLWDSSLCTRSRHRMKGEFCSFAERDGRHYVLALKDETEKERMSFGEAPNRMRLRLYEIT